MMTLDKTIMDLEKCPQRSMLEMDLEPDGSHGIHEATNLQCDSPIDE